MLSVFPELLFLSPLAATLIRIALAAFFGYEGWVKASRTGGWSRVEGASALALAVVLFIGAWTQLAALVAALSLVLSVFIPRCRTLPISTVLLALAMALSLIVTGAGALAFDLPL